MQFESRDQINYDQQGRDKNSEIFPLNCRQCLHKSKM